MRSPNEIKERIQLAIVEHINSYRFEILTSDPSRFIPIFIQSLTEKITEITLDEITFRKRI